MNRILGALIVAAVFAVSAAAAQDFEIAPGDSLSITVLEDPGLNREVLVRPDGKISLPLAGTVQAAGLTPEALQKAVQRALGRDFVQPPTVTVSLSALGRDNLQQERTVIYVIGQVANPGRYEVEPPIDALQALALSGGAGPFAARQRIQIRRTVNGVETVTFFNYDLVESGATPLARVRLEDGDVIVVPERGLFE